MRMLMKMVTLEDLVKLMKIKTVKSWRGKACKPHFILKKRWKVFKKRYKHDK